MTPLCFPQDAPSLDPRCVPQQPRVFSFLLPLSLQTTLFLACPASYIWAHAFTSTLPHGTPLQLEGLLKLSLVSASIAIYPATSESEKVRFKHA